MKRLMTIFFIMALTNFANSGTVDIVISGLNGQLIDPTKEITMMPSDEVGLGIIYIPSPGLTLFVLSVDMFASVPGLGTLDPSEPTWPVGVWDLNPPLTGTQVNPDGSAGIWALPADYGLNEGVAVENIVFHCDAPGTVVIRLRENPNLFPGESNEIDSSFNLHLLENYGTGVIIHQIPEPATILLFGLGVPILAGFLRGKR